MNYELFSLFYEKIAKNMVICEANDYTDNLC